MKRDDSDPRYRALIQLLRTSELIWEASRVFFARWDISPSQFNILNLLRDFPDGCTQTDLSRLLIMHRSNVTGMVDRLEARGLVRRKGDPADRRVFHVRLTAKADALLARILPEYYEAAQKLWQGVDDRRTVMMTKDLEVLAANLDGVISEDTEWKHQKRGV